MEKLINNKYANFYLNAAKKLNLEYSILNDSVGLATIFKKNIKLDISSNVLSINNQVSASLSVNKVKTSILLKAKKIPVPSFKTFTNSKEAVDYAIGMLKNNKKVVIKPISGSLSFGITVSPSNISQIKKAVAEAFEGNSSIMIEEYVSGRHFRITILDTEIIAITERIGAYVMADGMHSVNDLIGMKNKQRNKLHLPQIHLREKDHFYLKSAKIELQKVYPEGIYIMLQLGCDLDIGGERIRVEKNDVPEVNKALFVNAAKALGLKFAGIDYITPDIAKPYTSVKSAINEINSAPDSDVHYKDSFPYDNYAAELILKKIFNSSDNMPKKQFVFQVTPAQKLSLEMTL